MFSRNTVFVWIGLIFLSSIFMMGQDTWFPEYKNWNKVFGGSGDDIGYSVMQTSDEGYVVSGSITNESAILDGLLLKTDEEGNEEWRRIFGGDEPDAIHAVDQTSDGGFILAGGTTSFGIDSQDAWLIKTDAAGIEEWSRVYGGSGTEIAYSVQQTADGGYIFCGYDLYGQSDFLLVKTDASGNEEFYLTFEHGGMMGESTSDRAYCVRQTVDAGYIVAGYTTYSCSDCYDLWLIKTDDEGNQEWDKLYFSTGFHQFASVEQTSDLGYIVAGQYGDMLTLSANALLLKTDPDGVTEWSKLYSGSANDRASSVQETSDGCYIFAGFTDYDSGLGTAAAWLVKTDANGDMIWDRVFDGDHYDYGFCARQTADNGCILTGTTKSFGSGLLDVWLIKTDHNGYAPAEPSL